MTIAPGIMETPMLLGMPQEVQDALGKMVPFPRAWASRPNSPPGAPHRRQPLPERRSHPHRRRHPHGRQIKEHFMTDPIVIVAARRTPSAPSRGSSPRHRPAAGQRRHCRRAGRHRQPRRRHRRSHPGLLLPAGLKQAPARQAVLGAGLPAVPATTVNKMCGSA
jgi:hypothetical protein